MSNKLQIQKNRQTTTKRENEPDNVWNSKRNLLIPLILAIVVWIVFSPIVSAGFINWDDPSYIQYNNHVRNFGWSSVRTFFSEYFLGNYHPLTLLVHSIAFNLFGDAASGHHVLNLLLHISNTLLVFYIFRSLFPKKQVLPVVTALLFGIHPMHIESVAWISELKDQLYSVFLLASLLVYTKYQKEQDNKRFYFISLGFYVASLLSKGQAVVLPVLMLLIDYLVYGKLNKQIIIEKIPFFLLSFVFGIIAIFAQDTAFYESGINLSDQIWFRFLAFLIYLFKFIMPIHLSGFHEYPYLKSGEIPQYIYLAPVLTIALLYLVFRYRKNRYIVIGSLFFILSLLPLLIVPLGKSFIAERYTYIPYIGLSFLLIAFTDHTFFPKMKDTFRNSIWIILAFLLIGSAGITYNRTHVWKNSQTFWTDVTEKYPNSLIAREHLAMHYYYDADNIESAISELETAITIDPAYKTAYRLAGFLYQQLGNNEVAIKYLSKAIELDSSEVDAILYRANSYRNMGNLTKALADYSVALQKSPERQDLWIARGALYADTLKDYSKALFDFYRAYQIDTTDINTAFNLALTYYKSGSYDSSVWFSDKALRTGNKSANFIKSLSLNKLKRFKESHDAAVQAEKDGIVVPDSLMQK